MQSPGSLKMEEGIGSGNQRGGSVRRTRPDTAGFEDGERGPWTKECWWILQAGKRKETDPGLEPIERNAALKTHWFSAQWDPLWVLYSYDLGGFPVWQSGNRHCLLGNIPLSPCGWFPPALGSFLSHTADQYCWILKWSDPLQISGLCFLGVCPLFSNHVLSMPASLFPVDAPLCLLKWGGAAGSAFVSPPHTVAWKRSQHIKLNSRRLISPPFLKDHLPLLPVVQCLEILFHIFLLFFSIFNCFRQAGKPSPSFHLDHKQKSPPYIFLNAILKR